MRCFRFFALLVLIVCTSLLAPSAFSQTPEPAGWYAGDMHVHRSCGGAPESVSSMFNRMSPQNLSAESLLADMGNGEVQNPITDLPLVTGLDDPISTSSRKLHWDVEWHWDAIYTQYPRLWADTSWDLDCRMPTRFGKNTPSRFWTSHINKTASRDSRTCSISILAFPRL